MKRVSILLVLVMFSTSFLLLQLFFLHDLGQPQKKSFLKLGSWFLFQQSKDDNEIWRNTKDFLTLAKKHEMAVILVDYGILSQITASNQGHTTTVNSFKDCSYLCTKSSVTFAVIREHRLSEPLFLSSLTSHGFTQRCKQTSDPRETALDKWSSTKMISHCSFTRGHAVIHLVVLYKRRGYLWYGGVEINPTNITKNVGFANSAGAYDRFEVSDQIVLDGLVMEVPQNPTHFLQQAKQSQFTECDIQQARQFYNTYGQDMSTEAEVFRHRAREILVKAKVALDQVGIRFWLSSGTCLGWFRQCGIIPHSKDVDLGVWINDYKPSLITELDKQGLMLKHKFGKIEDSFELSFRTVENDVKLDIFFFYEEKEYMWNGGTQARTGKKFKYIFPKFCVCWTDFLELKVRVPCPARPYVEANYGTSWNRPVKQWNWKESPPNVRENGRWDEKDWPEVIQHF